MQERDFINVIDVAAAISLIVDQKTDNCYEEYEVCTGNVITIKKFAEIVKKATNSSTTLNFGSKNYRQNEIMKLKPNPTKLLSLGWSPSLKLENGIEKMLM